MKNRPNKYDMRSALLREIDRAHAPYAPHGWQRRFAPGEGCEFAVRSARDGAIVAWLAGCVVRVHRVGFLVRGPRGLAYAPYSDVRPRGWGRGESEPIRIALTTEAA